ncbi:MAG TPA: Crp/Fnr family transcriptional regulator [Pyrinomonadaceae bacterium]|nr:Crp/Fnr family transcriptional regulator [Pyrinomonadaceae bacterium]
MVAVLKQVAIENRILASLPHRDFERLLSHLTPVNLERGEVVYITGDTIRDCYFLNSGLLSLLSSTETGSTVEVAMVGNEGMVGLPIILKNRIFPYEVTVQIEAEALRIRAEDLQAEFDRGGALQDLMLRYLNVLITEISQSSLCHRFHTLEEALSRWLLMAQDRLNTNNLNLTQEIISHALGVPRTGVTMAAGSLQRAGLIRYSRGKIVILDRAQLEARACECFRIIHDELNHFLRD